MMFTNSASSIFPGRGQVSPVWGQYFTQVYLQIFGYHSDCWSSWHLVFISPAAEWYVMYLLCSGQPHPVRNCPAIIEKHFWKTLKVPTYLCFWITRLEKIEKSLCDIRVLPFTKMGWSSYLLNS